MKKKGQAAMEFLMTYGWAILAAIIVVGVLWYLIGNPADLAGSRFTIGAPLVSNAMALSTDSIQIEFRNGGAEPINVTQVQIEGCGTDSTGGAVAAGAMEDFTVTCSPALTSGSRFNGAVTIRYTVGDGAVVQQTTGTISGRVP